MSGIGVGAGVAGTLWLSAPVARSETVRTAGVVVGQYSDAEWRAHIDTKLTELGERLARIEGRLDRR